MKRMIFLFCIFALIPILPNNASSQSSLLARRILIEQYNYFNETTQMKELFQAIEESFSKNWSKKEIDLSI